MIKSSKHTIKFANTGKKLLLTQFLLQYREAVSHYVDFLWHNPYTYGTRTFDISHNLLNCPSMLDYKVITFTTNLSARALSSAATQACGIVKTAVRKQSKRLYKLEQLIKENATTTNLQNKIDKTTLIKPTLPENFRAELSSNNAKIIGEAKSFNHFLKLSSLGKSFGTIYIPIKHHRHSNHLKQSGDLMTSFLVSDSTIDLRWNIPDKPKRTIGITLGTDQGKNDVLTFSDSTTTPKTDVHGHSLSSIMDKLSRKTKGSKAFKRAQDHRENFINWSINQLNLDNIQQINLENIVNINYGRNTSRLMSHWTNTLIRDKLVEACESNGVRLVLQSSTYRSQRCSSCGLVRKANRKGKVYKCKCGLDIDADLNAALNHAIDLPDVPWALRRLNKNRSGFYWQENGFYDLTGGHLEFPLQTKS